MHTGANGQPTPESENAGDTAVITPISERLLDSPGGSKMPEKNESLKVDLEQTPFEPAPDEDRNRIFKGEDFTDYFERIDRERRELRPDVPASYHVTPDGSSISSNSRGYLDPKAGASLTLIAADASMPLHAPFTSPPVTGTPALFTQVDTPVDGKSLNDEARTSSGSPRTSINRLVSPKSLKRKAEDTVSQEYGSDTPKSRRLLPPAASGASAESHMNSRMRMRGDVLDAIANGRHDAKIKKENYDRTFRGNARQLDARSRSDEHGVD